MIYKTLFLVSFAIFFGMNTSLAQEEPCNCIDEISAAVENVMATSGCDEATLWEAPKALKVHLAKLQNWCGVQNKPLKSKIPNIVEGMLETIQDAYAGEFFTDPISGEVIVIQEPAPECALEALAALEIILLNGCE
jgi:hypothetical protein